MKILLNITKIVFFLDRIEKKFGVQQKNNILEMTKIKLKRKIVEENFHDE